MWNEKRNLYNNQLELTGKIYFKGDDTLAVIFLWMLIAIQNLNDGFLGGNVWKYIACKTN